MTSGAYQCGRQVGSTMERNDSGTTRKEFVGKGQGAADTVLSQAVVEAMRSGAGTAGAIVQATSHTGEPLVRRRHALMAILSEGKGLARVPLSMITAETPVLTLDLRAGRSSTGDFRRFLGPGSSKKLEDGTTVRLWTLTEAGGRRDRGRVPYALREVTNPMRPAYCAIPFSALDAGEALRLRAVFGAGGVTSALLFVE